jgi:hypothetical protein
VIPPWCQPFHPELTRAVTQLGYADLLAWLSRQAQSRGLLTGDGNPLHFVPQTELPVGTPYETWIATTGGVPTRDNLHDRYNALIWLTYPRTKAKLNAIQSNEIAYRGASGTRGIVRDAATIWDENLAVIAATSDSDLLQAALQSRDWQRLFLLCRGHWHSHWNVRLFGHALLEKLAAPYKSITAHAIVVSTADLSHDALDQQLAMHVHAGMSNTDYSPLPVMGVPGWHDGNNDSHFYADPKVFRPMPPS